MRSGASALRLTALSISTMTVHVSRASLTSITTLSLVLISGSARHARAQGAAPEANDARAIALFREGRQLLKLGEYTPACKRFRQSLELKRSPGILLNVGDCQVREGDLDGALETFEAARLLSESAPEGAVRTAWLADAQREIAALELRVAEARRPPPSSEGNAQPSTAAAPPEPATPERVPAPPATDADIPAPPTPAQNGWGSREWILLSEGLAGTAAAGFGVWSTVMRGQSSENLEIATRRTRDLNPTAQSGAECSDAPMAALATACRARARLAADEQFWAMRQWIGFGVAGALGVALVVTAVAWKADGDSAQNGPRLVAAADGRDFWLCVAGSY